jgi:poly-gamma-glutamate synthesis protein (capsule biosynthesis protein)
MFGSDSLLFLGDVTCPHGMTPQLRGIDRLPGGRTIVNLEGPLCAPGEEQIPPGSTKGVVVYYSVGALETLKTWNVVLATLANNHLLDNKAPPSRTIARLADAGIGACGAGDDAASAAAPAKLPMGGARDAANGVVILAFGWETIECEAVDGARPGVNPLRPAHVLASVQSARADHPSAKVVAVMHWDYELERYPMPAQRQLAHDVIAAGADAVIGHHPHCVQGIEWVDGRPIAYSVGNWFFPQGNCFGKPTEWPDYVSRQLALEWDPADGGVACHWFDYRREDHSIRFVASEPAKDSAEVRTLTPFAGLSHAEYIRFFRGNRVKKKGLPIYRDYRQTVRNRMFDRWNAWRMRAIRWLRK